VSRTITRPTLPGNKRILDPFVEEKMRVLREVAELFKTDWPNIPEHCPKWIGTVVRIDRNPQRSGWQIVHWPGSRGQLLPETEVVDPPAFPHKLPFPEKIIKKLS
jgi:hypothetical protein